MKIVAVVHSGAARHIPGIASNATLVAIAILATPLAAQPQLPPNALRVGVFDVDVSPPIGSPMAYNSCMAIAMPLRAKGMVLLGQGRPIVLCAVDWIGIANEGHTRWRRALAEAAGTNMERVSVHTVHQHDAPFYDASAEAVLAGEGIHDSLFDNAFMERTIARVAVAVSEATTDAKPVTHLGLGKAEVHKVASNRRILGEDGKVRGVRYTACSDARLRAEPEGLIDPFVRSISFWQNEEPLAVMTYYATHPQSYYSTGIANPDFPGIARYVRQVTHNGLPHIHFNGAGGNIGAGKYNDGSRDNRQVLAQRLADGMAAAWHQTERHAITAQDVSWSVARVALPPAPHLHREQLLAVIRDSESTDKQRNWAAADLAWWERCRAGEELELSCLGLGRASIVHLPGESVVEYQLAAQQLRPDLFVAVAAYADYGPGYICLEKHYAEGGYEPSPRASRVAPSVEHVMTKAISQVLESKP